ncbi:MAG TPA: hypothetical protein DCP28_26615 [Cytophagales bacterium]|nr:hypothetical protein [Cytophagales bacterium]
MMNPQGQQRNILRLAAKGGLLWLLFSFCTATHGQSSLGIARPFVPPDSLFTNWDQPDDPGGLVMVMQGEEVLWQQTYGMAHLSQKRLNQLNQPMSLASVSKQFAATCIALLEEQGKLSIEDPITKYYPEFQAESEIKIRNLLDHSSGLRDGYVLALLTMGLRGLRYEQVEPKELVAMVAEQRELNFTPGSEFAYTNTNYVMLADLVERVSGQSLREYADSAIFRPLGMTNTYFNDVAGADGPEGYVQKKPGKYTRRMVRGGVVGDSHLVSTLPDLAQWEANMWNNRLGKGDPALIQRMWTPTHLNDGSSSGYGYGVSVSEREGVRWVEHGGDNDIQTSIIIRVPEHQLSVVILANSNRYADTSEKGWALAHHCLGIQSSGANAPEAMTWDTLALSAEQLSRYEGIYGYVRPNSLGVWREAKVKEGTLWMTGAPSHPGLPLLPVAENHFVAINREGRALHLYFEEEAGKLKGFREEFPTYEVPFEFKYLANHSPSLKAYRGIYHHADTGARLQIRTRKGKLQARVRLMRLTLIPFGTDQYYEPGEGTLFLFERDENGLVTKLTVNARDFRNFTVYKE